MIKQRTRQECIQHAHKEFINVKPFLSFEQPAWPALIASFTLCAASLPGPAVDESRSEKKSETVVLAGGCFWGVQAVFSAIKGVPDAVSGYAGGSKANAHYEIVSTGTTGHAESVQVTFDPSQVSFGQLLKIYFSVAHDPTELNRQGPDEGTQYRSEIFYTSDRAEAYRGGVHPAVDRGQGIHETHRHQGGSAAGVLSGRGLSSELRTTLQGEFARVHQQGLRRLQRPSQVDEPARGVPGNV